ncbi:MAG: ethanolamine ammonia-lyase reactivating factor EutA [Oscillospiraceae bacterium]
MSERLLSVGLDVGTTSTQMVVSELLVENRASGFAVPEMVIADRKILYRSPVYFTPLVEGKLVNGEELRSIVEEEYRKAGITREKVDTGAVIITGETSRKENARTVVNALSEYAGEFVVATAGPDLESVLAAKGAGAADYSSETGKTVLHMDIGGGTSNLALIRDGKILRTGCLNVGGRLVKFSQDGLVSYLSPVLRGLSDMQVGERSTKWQRTALAEKLASALEMAAGRKPTEPLLSQLLTEEAGKPWVPPEEPVVVSFSGGVADCIREELEDFAFGDLGPELGRAIRRSSLYQSGYILGRETIRATVIGAGCYSTQLSGSTVYHQNVKFPLKNVPVVKLSDREKGIHSPEDGPVILVPEEIRSFSYRQIVKLADRVSRISVGRILVCLEQDMAKALGHALAVRMPADAEILCIDRIRVEEGSYLDIGQPVAGAVPVVVKTLVLSK